MPRQNTVQVLLQVKDEITRVLERVGKQGSLSMRSISDEVRQLRREMRDTKRAADGMGKAMSFTGIGIEDIGASAKRAEDDLQKLRRTMLLTTQATQAANRVRYQGQRTSQQQDLTQPADTGALLGIQRQEQAYKEAADAVSIYQNAVRGLEGIVKPAAVSQKALTQTMDLLLPKAKKGEEGLSSLGIKIGMLGSEARSTRANLAALGNAFDGIGISRIETEADAATPSLANLGIAMGKLSTKARAAAVDAKMLQSRAVFTGVGIRQAEEATEEWSNDLILVKKRIQRILPALERMSRGGARAIGGLLAVTRRWLRNWTLLTGSILSAQGIFSIGARALHALRRAIGATVAEASEFTIRMSEISTILPDAEGQMGRLARQVSDLSVALNSPELDVARGLYQAISAGFSDSADAMLLLEQSARLGTAGLASTEDTINLLTTAVNAYRLEVEDAARISDISFETVRLGKTTISELSTEIGKALPLAASLGISYEEVAAAAATLTQQGFNTSESATAVRALFKALLRQTGQLDLAFRKTGETYTLQTAQAKGLVETLRILRDSVVDDSEAMLVLGGRVEAANALFGLTGKNLGAFERILDGVTNSAGATDEALAKMLENDSVFLQRAMKAVTNESRLFGESIIEGAAIALREYGGIERLQKNLRAGFEGLQPVVMRTARNLSDWATSFLDFVENAELIGAKAALSFDRFTTGAGDILDILGFDTAVERAEKKAKAIKSVVKKSAEDIKLADLEGTRSLSLRREGEVLKKLLAARERFNAGASQVNILTGSGSAEFIEERSELEERILATKERIKAKAIEELPIARELVIAANLRLDRELELTEARERNVLALEKQQREFEALQQSARQSLLDANLDPDGAFVKAIGGQVGKIFDFDALQEESRKAGSFVIKNLRETIGGLELISGGTSVLEKLAGEAINEREAERIEELRQQLLALRREDINLAKVLFDIEGDVEGTLQQQAQRRLDVLESMKRAKQLEISALELPGSGTTEAFAALTRTFIKGMEEDLKATAEFAVKIFEGAGAELDLKVDTEELIALRRVFPSIDFEMVLTPTVDTNELDDFVARLRSEVTRGPGALEAQLNENRNLFEQDVERLAKLREQGNLMEEQTAEARRLLQVRRQQQDAEARFDSEATALAAREEGLRTALALAGTSQDRLEIERKILAVQAEQARLEATRSAFSGGAGVLGSTIAGINAVAGFGASADAQNQEKVNALLQQSLRWKLQIAETDEERLEIGNKLLTMQTEAFERQLRDAGLDPNDGKGAELKAQFVEVNQVRTEAEREMAAFASNVRNNFESGLGNAFLSFIDGSKSAKEAFADFAREVIAQTLAMIAVQGVLFAISGGTVGIFSAVAQGKGGVNKGGLTPIKPFAKGGVQKGGFGEADMYGVTSGPMLAVIGEKKGQDEAVVPLPDNKSIPVTFTNGGGGGGGGAPVINMNVPVSVSAIDMRDFGDRIDEVSSRVGASVKQQLIDDPSLVRMIRMAARASR